MAKKRKKTLKGILPPFKAQSYYEKELMALVDDMEKKLFKKFKNITDSELEEAILTSILNYLDNPPLFNGIPLFEATALKFVTLVNDINSKKFNKALEEIELKEIITPKLTKQLAKHRTFNVGLIKSIPEKLHGKLEIKLKDYFEGNSKKSLESIIRDEFEVTRSRAKFIARDQTAKVNASLTRSRAEANGSKEYTWRTSGDNAVRETAGHNHKKLNGKKFKWSEGSPCCGHPADEHGCRCSARAVFLV